MEDYLGQQISIGDRVSYIHHTKTSSEFNIESVKELTEKMVRLSNNRLKSPYLMIVINEIR